MGQELLYYAAGYLYSILAGQLFISWFSRIAWEALDEIPDGKKDAPHRWTTSLVGVIDRVIYTSSLLFAAKEFIAVWLAFKIASQWKKWEDNKDLSKARAIFNLFIVGTGLSLLYGAVGGLLVVWLKEGEYLPAIAISAALIILNLFFILIANNNKKVGGKKK